MKTNHPVVIVGGGFGGVYTARKLLKQNIPVLLISETNYFTFTPLLHEVATGILSRQDVIFEFASFFKNRRFSFLRGRVETVDFKKKCVHLDGKDISYDMLVLATGAGTNFYGMKGSEHAFELKSLEDAIKLKKRMIELAQGLEKNLQVNVIGAGPTGIELILEIKLFLDQLKKNNPDVSYYLRVIQSGDAILKAFPPGVQAHAERVLKRQGIELVLGARATEVTASQLKTDKGDFSSNLTVMAAGVKPSTACITNGELDRGHVCVDEFLRVEGQDHVFALGDIILQNRQMVPKLAQTAVQEARVVAENIVRTKKKKPLMPYRLKLKGMMLSLGYREGAGEVFGVTLKGILAWFIWRTVYFLKTPGLYNKWRVSFSWTVELFQKRNLVEE